MKSVRECLIKCGRHFFPHWMPGFYFWFFFFFFFFFFFLLPMHGDMKSAWKEEDYSGIAKEKRNLLFLWLHLITSRFSIHRLHLFLYASWFLRREEREISGSLSPYAHAITNRFIQRLQSCNHLQSYKRQESPLPNNNNRSYDFFFFADFWNTLLLRIICNTHISTFFFPLSLLRLFSLFLSLSLSLSPGWQDRAWKWKMRAHMKQAEMRRREKAWRRNETD